MIRQIVDKKVVSLLVMTLLITATFGAVVLVKRIQETRRGAAGNAVDITFSPSSGNYQVGDEFNVTVIGTPPQGKALGAFMLTLAFDESKLEVVGGASGVTTLQANLRQKSLNAGQIFVLGTPNSFSLNAVNLFRVRFKAKAGGETQLTVNQGGEASICLPSGNQCNESTIQDVGITFQPAVFNLGSGATPTSGRRIQSVNLNPSQGDFRLNREFTVAVGANTGNNRVTEAELVFNFDNNKLEIIDAGSQIFGEPDVKILGNDQGKTTVFFGFSGSGTPPSGEFEIARFRLKGKSLGAVTLTPEKIRIGGNGWIENAVLSGIQGQYQIVSVDTPTSTPVPTATEAPEPTPTEEPEPTPTEAPDENTPILNFKIKFSKVTYKIDDQKVVVKVRKGNLQREFTGVDVVADNEGVLSGEVALTNITPGSGYSIIIKGPKHLATRFCQNEQESRCLGEGNITLAAGENTFDFTGIPLLAGDIPDDNNLQNGIVDMRDFGRLKGAIVATDEDLRSRCNLDFDKDDEGKDIISGRDITLYLDTLSQRYDEDY